MRLLDLFCGRWGWSRAFAARGWECVGVDLIEHPAPFSWKGTAFFIHWDILDVTVDWILKLNKPDFIVASPPCEEFSVHGMKHFFPNPKYPEMGIKLFNHTRSLCEASGVPYVMENVRAAQQFVGNAVHHCGAFHLWGNAVPPLLPRNIWKGWEHKYVDKNGRKRGGGPGRYEWSTSEARKEAQSKVATIPPELANCIAAYAERLLEQQAEQRPPAP